MPCRSTGCHCLEPNQQGCWHWQHNDHMFSLKHATWTRMVLDPWPSVGITVENQQSQCSQTVTTYLDAGPRQRLSSPSAQGKGRTGPGQGTPPTHKDSMPCNRQIYWPQPNRAARAAHTARFCDPNNKEQSSTPHQDQPDIQEPGYVQGNTSARRLILRLRRWITAAGCRRRRRRTVPAARPQAPEHVPRCKI